MTGTSPAAWRCRLLHPSRWSLRSRVTASVSLVLVVLCTVITTVSLVAVQQFLIGRLDGQLADAVHRSQQFTQQPDRFERRPDTRGRAGAQPGDTRGRPNSPGGADGELPPPLRPFGQAAGTVGAMVKDGVVTAGLIGGNGDIRTLDPGDQARLKALPADGRSRTVDLAEGDYRVAALPGGRGSVVITGLPLGQVHETVYEVASILVVVSLLALAVAVLATRLVVLRALAPLRRVAATATHVAETPLDRGEVALAVRVPDTDPHTEVGQVGTALNRMLENVASALAARHESETKVRQFVADAGHELRTPLAALRGYAELSHRFRQQTPPDVVQALERMESAALRMSDIVTDLLLLARLDAGRPLEREPVDLTLVCLEALDDARAAGADHRWRLDLPQEPIEVTGDPLRLHQVVANLLTNAWVHTPAGTTATLTLRRLPSAGGGESAVLVVADDGPGIPAEILPTVFERFVRADSSRARAMGGDGAASGGSTGLGLAIVSAVLEAHGGSITVASEPGSTRFTVTLPAEPATQVESYSLIAAR